MWTEKIISYNRWVQKCSQFYNPEDSCLHIMFGMLTNFSSFLSPTASKTRKGKKATRIRTVTEGKAHVTSFKSSGYFYRLLFIDPFIYFIRILPKIGISEEATLGNLVVSACCGLIISFPVQSKQCFTKALGLPILSSQ